MPAMVGGVAVLALAIGWSVGHLTRPHGSPAVATVHRSTPTTTASAQRLAFTRPMPPPVRQPVPAEIGVMEVCGFGWVRVPPDDPDPLQRIPSALRQSALDAMDAAMLASDDTQ
ncbi:MAG TPA: hypothetical protein VHQ87_16190, partial [Rhizobacter sp.]|nr:hypothetical protein [Rhizobacter sp.]